jgi:hypothetical protein
MKKIVVMLASAGFLIAGCTKTDVTRSSSLSAEVSGNLSVDLSKCKIRRIYQNDFNGYITALFTYNKAGNPYSVIYSDGGTGVDDHHFYYDAKNRLIRYELDWIGYTTEDHYYFYNTANQIIKDSMRDFNCCGVLDAVNVSAIEYDNIGRVVKETIVNKYRSEGQPLLPVHRPTYTYDSRGNLAVAGWKSSSYDYKINPLRQNPIFQFIHRNYSMNNAAVQPKYNSIGLPLSMKPTNDYFFNNLETLKVIYDCQ